MAGDGGERTLRLAAVQAAPAFLDRAASTAKAVALVEEAGAAGADVVGFPEGFLPGHPGWVELLPLDDRALGLSRRLFEQAVEVPGPEVEALGEACGRCGVAAVVGVCERRPRTTGTLFNSQVFLDADGSYAGRHQKLVPTVGERLVHAPGTTGSHNHFRVAAHDVTVSALICGENSNPLAQYASARAYPVVHVASWPQHFNPGVPMGPVVEMVSRALAYSLKTFVVNAVSTVSDAMLDAYADAGTRAWLTSEAAPGRASIVGPTGDVLARAAGPEEQLVLADVDPGDVLVPKFVQDTAGHYNRPELFAHLFAAPDDPTPGWGL